MRAGHCQHVPALKHVFGQPLRSTGVRRPALHNGLHQGEFGRAVRQAGSADHIAHHVHVRLQGHLIGSVAFHQIDAQGLELVTHGGVDGTVTAGDAMPGLPRQSGQAAHERAADAQDMYMHGRDSRVRLQ